MDEAAFEAFYAASATRVLGQVAALTGDWDSAQDVVQEAFVREVGAPVGTVKSRLARGRAALAPLLDEHPAAGAPDLPTPELRHG